MYIHVHEGVFHSHHCDSIIVEHSRDIFGRELVRGVTYEKARLANRTVANDYASRGRNARSAIIVAPQLLGSMGEQI